MQALHSASDGIVSFLAQLDWKSPYTWLGILGALGAPSSVWKTVRWVGKLWNTSLIRLRHPAILKDFYYRSRDFGYRVMEDGITYVSVRREEIVSLSTLESVPLNYRWTGSGEVAERIEPNHLEIKDRPKIIGKLGIRRSVFFEKALDKGQESTFIVVLTCKAVNGQPENMIATSTARRVDKLVLRVAFPLNNRPSHVTYRLLDSDGVEIAKATLECSDFLTGEYRKEISYPKPFFEHRIEWE